MRRLSDDAGNVVVTTAMLMTVLFGFLALTVDAGTSLVRKSELQSGADAAALAIAKRCAEYVVSGGPSCTTSIASGYFSGNALDPTAPVTVTPTLQTSYDGQAGRITVVGEATMQPRFASVLGVNGAQTVQATATARWGPLTAEDAAFPLAVCEGALPDPGPTEVTLTVDPSGSTPPVECDGNPSATPFGWIPVDDATLCTSHVTLLPPTYLSVAEPDSPPSSTSCNAEIYELLWQIRGLDHWHYVPSRGGYHWSHSSSADRRTRVLAVYDEGLGGSGSHPSVALIAFEFTGMRLGPDDDQEADGSAWSEPCDASTICIRGRVRTWNPPTDGPIADLSVLGSGGFDATTVLDVRLVD